MEREEIFKKLQEDFVAAGKKDDFLIVAGALQAGLKPEEVRQYMTSKLSADQLLEQLAGILDGLPKQTLEQFSKGTISAEDMQIMRISSRGDTLFGIMMQEIRNLSDTIMDRDYIKEIADVLKGVKDLKKEISKLKTELANMQSTASPTETIEDIQQMEVREQMARPTGMEENEAFDREEISEASVPHSFAQPDAYITENGITVQKKEHSKEKPNRLLSFFRHMNSEKLEQDEEKKRLAVIEFVKNGLDDQKLEAVSEAVRYGVPYDHLKYIIDKDGNAEKIRKMTQIYLYLFSSSQVAAA